MNIEIRKLFPVTDNYVYLNHAAVAPISIPVFQKMQEYTRDLLDHGLVHYQPWLDAVKKVRYSAASLIKTDYRQIAFAPNTSAGLSMVANGIEWRRGDNLVTADCEFPANAIPWLRIEREFGVEIRRVSERAGRLETEEILSLIDARTRVVSLSFVEFASGFRNDLATIGRYCRERETLFVVDAIQGLGALAMDVEGCCIDALSADAHKFLLGPDGCALLYLSPRALERVKPTLVGWLSVQRPEDYFNYDQPLAPSARRFEPGALNTAGVVGLGAAIDLFLEVGIDKIENYLLELGDHLCRGLEARGYQLISSRRTGEKSAVICCRHEKHPAESLYRHLNEHRIITTSRLGRLRISPHFYNTRDEIDRMLMCLPE